MAEPNTKAEPAPTGAEKKEGPQASVEERETISWFIKHAPLSFWTLLAVAFSSVYSAGIASANVPIVQGVIESLFADKKPVDVNSFVNKAVTEKGTYTVGKGPDMIEIYIADVSVARQMAALEIGLMGREKKKFTVTPNTETSVPIGTKVFRLLVHDLADATVGADIAVISFQQMQK